MASGDADTVLRTVTLFNELLGLAPLPKFLRFANHLGCGEAGMGRGDQPFRGPQVYHEESRSRLLLVEQHIAQRERDKIEALEAIIKEEAEPDLGGVNVFDYLCRQVIERSPVIKP